MEKWIEIKGNREIYLVSNYGYVKTKTRIGARGAIIKGHDLKTHENSNGYLRVSMNLTGKSKEYLVHRLVAESFIPNSENKKFVNHKDGNKANNHVDNLEWCTRSENEKHAWKIGLKKDTATKGELHGMHKLTQRQVDYIRKNHKPYDKMFGSKSLAKKFNVSPQTITNIVNYKNWIEKLPHAKELIINE